MMTSAHQLSCSVYWSDVVQGSLFTPRTAGCCRGEAAAEASAELTRRPDPDDGGWVPPRCVTLLCVMRPPLSPITYPMPHCLGPTAR